MFVSFVFTFAWLATNVSFGMCVRVCEYILILHCRSWNRNSVRFPHHRLRQEPELKTAAVLVRHLGFRLVRGHGTVLSHDGLPVAVRLLKRLVAAPIYIFTIISTTRYVDIM